MLFRDCRAGNPTVRKDYQGRERMVFYENRFYWFGYYGKAYGEEFTEGGL